MYAHLYSGEGKKKKISSSAPSFTTLNLSVVEEDRMEIRLISLLILKITTTFTPSQRTGTLLVNGYAKKNLEINNHEL